ncbi:MAG: DUF6382 domain-containing protein [Ignavibacteriales bacterium]
MGDRIFNFDFSQAQEGGKQQVILQSGGSEPLRVIQYQVDMVMGNRIHGVQTMDVRRKDNQASIHYDVNGFVPLNQYIAQNQLTAQDFFTLIDSVIHVIANSQTYLLNEESFLLSERYIFIRNNCREVGLLYIPADFEQDFARELNNLAGFVAKNGLLPGEDQKPIVTGILQIMQGGSTAILELEKRVKKLRENTGIPAPAPTPQNTGNPTDFADFNYYQAPAEVIKPAQSVKPQPEPKQTKASQTESPEPANKRKYVLGAVAVLVLLLAAYSVLKDIPDFQTYIDSYLSMGVGVLLILVGVGYVIYRFKKGRDEKTDREDQQVNHQVQKVQNKAQVQFDAHVIPQNQPEPTPQGFPDLPPQPVPPVKVPDVPIAEDESTVLIEDDATVLLPQDDDSTILLEYPTTAVLKIDRNGREEVIPVNKPCFYIGRNRQVVHLCESDNMNIGRVHAFIEFENNVHYIVDLDSLNGTFVNDARIDSNARRQINFKDRIRLANIEYIFDQPQ